MNPISAFFVRNIVAVFFFYGLAFFVMGVALALASRQASALRFVRAIRPLALFGLLHGIHEWIEMFQKIGSLTSGYSPGLLDEIVRLGILVASLIMLLDFGVTLLNDAETGRWRRYGPVLLMLSVWAVGCAVVWVMLRPLPEEMVAMADVLARYSLGIPGAILGTWALMAQQRTFREHDMPQFGQDLVWSAAALALYGIFGQIFVRQTALVPSQFLNSTLFLQWTGIPIQLFRGVMAGVLTFYMVRALRAFDLENRRRLDQANRTQLAAQSRALEVERRVGQERERLNAELRLKARELGLLLQLSNMLTTSSSLIDRLSLALEQVVENLAFADAGLVGLIQHESGALQIRAVTGFVNLDPQAVGGRYGPLLALSQQCVEQRRAVCRHEDGGLIKFDLDAVLVGAECWQYLSPTVALALPLIANAQLIGVLALARQKAGRHPMTLDELSLTAGIARQLGLSIETARLQRQAQEREKVLAELLHQVVGAQESERQRIARELHDATGQSLTAIALGIRGLENALESQAPALSSQMETIESFATSALGELRRLIADLRPPQLDDWGLVAAIRWYVQSFHQHHPQTHVAVVVQGEQVRLSQEFETVIFRITQEALTNIAKHAHADQATITLRMNPDQLTLTVEDNGQGFDPNPATTDTDHPAGWGLLGIRERTVLLGGRYQIDSAPGQGTRVQVQVPVVAPHGTQIDS